MLWLTSPEILSFAPRDSTIPWKQMLIGMPIGTLLLLWLRSWVLRRLGRTLAFGDYLLTVRGDAGVTFLATYFDEVDIVWAYIDQSYGDPWHSGAYRSSGDPGTLVLKLARADGSVHVQHFDLSALLRRDNTVGLIVDRTGQGTRLRFRLMLDISPSHVRFILRPWNQKVRFSQPQADDAPWRFGAITILKLERDL